MKNWMQFVLSAPEGGEGAAGGAGGASGEGAAGGAGGASGEGAAGGAGGDKGDTGGSILAGDESGEGATGNTDGDKGGAGGSILAGDEGGKGGEGGKGDKTPQPEPNPEEIDAYLQKIKKIDLSDGTGPAPAWDDGALKVVAPLFIKHKISDAAANEIIAAYGQHVSGQYKAASETDRQILATLRTECSKRFGNDLNRFASEGRRGGEHVFGKALFQRLARVEAFGSDPDIIQALAQIGRGLTSEGATGGEDIGSKAEKSLADRMYGPKRK